MKKIMNKFNMAIVSVMATMPAFAANEVEYDTNALCDVLKNLHSVFNLLRTFAFIGAAFLIAGWAWGFIAAGKIDAPKEAKEKGVALLVGFILLFTVGLVLQFVSSTSGAEFLGCERELFNW